MSSAQYRIEWECLSTNYKGNGQWYDTREILDENIKFMNKKYKGEINHWIGTSMHTRSSCR